MVTSSSDGSTPIIGAPQSTNAFIFVSSDTTIETISSNTNGVGTINNISRTLMTDDTGNIFVGIREAVSSSLSNLISEGGYVQIEEGSIATDYEPYTGGQPSPSPDYPQEINSIEGSLEFACNDNKGSSNQVTFDLGEEKLRSVGDVKDELVVDLDTGDYYKVENVGEVVLDGSDDETWNNIPDGTGKERYTSPIIQSLVYVGTKLCQSNYFKNDTSEEYYEDGTIKIAPSGGITIYDDLFTSLDNFKQWLSTHNTIVDYVLQNPTTVPLGTLSSEDLAKLSTFDGYNNLFINTNLGYMNIRVTYSTNTNYNENIILGDDSYYYGIVDNKQSLPEGKAKGTLCQTKDTKDFYIYNGEEWVPVDKTASFDLSNYLSKDNTTPYSPSDRYNPATKQYVDTNIQGLRIPTKVSQLENDSKYITENTNTLVNYYNKNNTYNKKEVDALIDSSGITPVSITLNGQKTTDANFYAPASGGTANQILISQGDAAPVWQNNTAVQTVNQDIKLVISDTQPEAPSSGFILWVDSKK